MLEKNEQIIELLSFSSFIINSLKEKIRQKYICEFENLIVCKFDFIHFQGSFSSRKNNECYTKINSTI